MSSFFILKIFIRFLWKKLKKKLTQTELKKDKFPNHKNFMKIFKMKKVLV